MVNYYIIFGILCAFATCGIAISSKTANSSKTLKLVHVIFRHGDRNPNQEGFYPGYLYSNQSFYKEGLAQLTNKGKLKVYNLGKFLRRRYNTFLTPYWHVNYLNARTTDTARTMMSLELVLAAMYPPRDEQSWSCLFWQPIPYNYLPLEIDKELYPRVACSKKVDEIIEGILKTSEYFKRYDQLKTIIDSAIDYDYGYLTYYNLYDGLLMQEEFDFVDPWIYKIYPEPLHSATIDTYYLFTNTTDLRRISAGYLIKKILDDTAMKINGTIQPAERKMFLYSGHEFNIVNILLSLNAVKISMIPPYGSYIIFEVHEIDGVYGIKLFYQFYAGKKPIAIKLPRCNYFCPYDEFYKLVKNILPESDKECFGS